jgi:palmitoyltransferase
VIWIYIPRFFAALDGAISGGRFVRSGKYVAQYLFHENHPLVLVRMLGWQRLLRAAADLRCNQILFITLLSVSEFVFIPAAWSRLALKHRLAAPVVVVLPYLFLYLSIVTKSEITLENHAQHMRKYPYDKVIFHPGSTCRTCLFLKPARSKHCSLCKACVARSDHHCIWLRTCVGQNNYRYFLLLLLSVSMLLVYGAYLGYTLLYNALQEALYHGPPGGYWSRGMPWLRYLEFLGLAIADDIRVGGVAFFALLTAPLSSVMLGYHIYLIWAGMTTNESGKWADWRDDIAYGVVYKAKASQIYPHWADDPFAEPHVSWPVTSDQTLVFTEGGEPPKVGSLPSMDRISIVQPDNVAEAPIDTRWAKVASLKEVTNIYDAGFWTNMRDSLGFNPR